MGQAVPADDLPQASSNAVPEDDLPPGFASTPGGAAVGSPGLARQGDRLLRDPQMSDVLTNIAGAGVTGGALGAFSKELLTGAGNVIGGFNVPAARTVGNFLKGAGQVIGAGGRTVPATMGAVSGVASETAGQAVEAVGGGPVAAETARLVAGGLGPETLTGTKALLKTYVLKPALGFAAHIKKQTAKTILEKLDGTPQTLTEQESKFVEQMIAELRGPGGKTNEPLEKVGSIMGAEGQRLMSAADQQMIAAQAQAAGVKPTGVQAELADIGGGLQTTINTRFKGALAERDAQYTANKKARDTIVEEREAAESYVTALPEYAALLGELKAQLVPGKRSPSVQAGYQKMLSELENHDVPITFQALDDVRRKLGDAFRGKPAEGYDAIGETAAKDLYGKVSNIQKQFAGGPSGPQTKLLDDYAEKTEGLNIFSSKYGKKSTALDQYREDTFATDPSTLPAAYFKTRASVQALKELTGNAAQVNHAALEFANRELAGKDAAAVRAWLGKNSEWLAETGPARTLVDRYATRLEVAERSLRNAVDFVAQATKDSSMLTRQALPAQRAVDMIRSGDTELWSKVVPVIVQSPQAKTQMVQAVRQVVADQATSRSTADLFERNIRPFLEQSGIAAKAEMDHIASRLANIQTLNVPEAEKLGIAKRLILQATGGWLSSAVSRTGAAAYQYVPDTEGPLPGTVPATQPTLRGINSTMVPQRDPAQPRSLTSFVRG